MIVCIKLTSASTGPRQDRRTFRRLVERLVGRIIPKSYRVLIVRTGVTVANMVQMNRKLGGVQRPALPQILAGNNHFVPRLKAGYGRFSL